MKSPQNHFCPFWSLSNFTFPNMSKCSQTLWTCSNGLITHLEQLAQVGGNVILIKVPQNPSCPEPNLNNSTLATFSFWSKLFLGMFRTSNDDTTPSGASRRTDLHDQILESPFLLISRVYKSCIGNFAQMDTILVEWLVFSCHLALSSLMTRGVHILAQTNIKHLLAES